MKRFTVSLGLGLSIPTPLRDISRYDRFRTRMPFFSYRLKEGAPLRETGNVANEKKALNFSFQFIHIDSLHHLHRSPFWNVAPECRTVNQCHLFARQMAKWPLAVALIYTHIPWA